MKPFLLAWLLFSCCLLAFPISNHANQSNSLDKLIKSRMSANPPNADEWPKMVANAEYTPVYIAPQEGLMEADKIDALPGQPEGVNFDQYSGYVTVNPNAGRALFYYFVESPVNSSTNPLVLWLNGGPGCSSLIGAMEEQGPFRVNGDGKTLYRNPYAWNNVANVIFLESPAGVGYSYSNTTSDYDNSGDKITAEDNYIFLVNWLERFPQYKKRDFFITGESYSGHYVPQLAYTILSNNKNSNQTVINLKGIAIGNPSINDYDNKIGQYDHFWSHAFNSDETHAAIYRYCVPHFTGDDCDKAEAQSDSEMGRLDIYNLYAEACRLDMKISNHTGSVRHYHPCTDGFVYDYLNLLEVQKAFRANPTTWNLCSYPWKLNWRDSPTTMLPIIKKLTTSNITVWIYSGDMDGRIPVTSTRYSINSFEFPIKTAWRPWYNKGQVGGFVIEYESLMFATVRGAGHEVPSYQPERALKMITCFLQGKELPLHRYDSS